MHTLPLPSAEQFFPLLYGGPVDLGYWHQHLGWMNAKSCWLVLLAEAAEGFVFLSFIQWPEHHTCGCQGHAPSPCVGHADKTSVLW